MDGIHAEGRLPRGVDRLGVGMIVGALPGGRLRDGRWQSTLINRDLFRGLMPVPFIRPRVSTGRLDRRSERSRAIALGCVASAWHRAAEFTALDQIDVNARAM